ncbi:hypothetical protein D9M72_441110 [compost metagenome]
MSDKPKFQPFVVYGKGEDVAYSVRTASGAAVCTCAYNPNREDRAATAQLIADALNAYAAAIAKATEGPAP